MNMGQKRRKEKKRGRSGFGRNTGMDVGKKIGRKEKKRGRRGFGRNTGMDVGQNRRREKKRGRKGFGGEDWNVYVTKCENRDIEGNEMV